MACRSAAGRELAAVILPTAGCSEEERKIDVARCWWAWSWDCRQCQSPPTLVVLSVLQQWLSMLPPQATETQTGDQGLDSAWWNGWNVFNGAWAAQPSSVPKLWESLAFAILDRKLLGVPEEEHMWAWRSECVYVEREGEMAANEWVEVSSASTPHCITLQGPYWWADGTVTPSFIIFSERFTGL